MVNPSARRSGATSSSALQIVGVARTATIRAAEPSRLPPAEARASRLAYYEYVASPPQPTLVVIQDVDSRIGFGCFWGEVQTAIHKGIGCQGLVTDGGVRDLDAVAPGFQVLCGKVTPSHAWVHAIAFGGTVDVFGMIARSDDLIHADRHGAVVIPAQHIEKMPAAIDIVVRKEQPVLKAARAPGFTVEKLRAAWLEADEIK